MGAGNPKLKSFDNDKFEPVTYFIDLGDDFDAVKQYLIDEEKEEPDDDRVWREVVFLEEMHFEDLIANVSSELGHVAHSLQKGNGYAELCYAFREEGLILTEGKTCYLITETGCEYSNLALAVIPNFKFEDFIQEAESEIWDKQDWYRARGKDWDAAVEKLAEKRWTKEMKVFRKEAEQVLKLLHSWYGDNMHARFGPWTSGPVDPAKLAA